ncbi:MAG: substrate-binding domain-containing protein [Bacteroidales bacterium]|nr:substrate-binding domain-containing protein [Bacteroidales bacterium]
MNVCKPFVFFLCIAVISGCQSRQSAKAPEDQQAPVESILSGDFTISGAYALYPLAQKWADDFAKIHPGVKIEISKTGTGQGIIDLLDKKVQLAMVSRPLTDEENEAGVWIIPVAKDGVAVIVNQKNPYLGKILKQGLSPDEFQRIFTGDKPVLWGELLDTVGNDKPIVYSRADESGAAEMLAGFIFKEQSDLKGIKVTGDDEMIKSIQKNPLAIGFCNFSFAFDIPTGERKENIQIVPFDLDYDNKIERKEMPFKNLEVAHRSIWLGFYPESLCRDLSIACLGKPSDPLITEFLKYVLSDGQENVQESGLCKLNNVYIRSGLESLQ